MDKLRRTLTVGGVMPYYHSSEFEKNARAAAHIDGVYRLVDCIKVKRYPAMRGVILSGKPCEEPITELDVTFGCIELKDALSRLVDERDDVPIFFQFEDGEILRPINAELYWSQDLFVFDVDPFEFDPKRVANYGGGVLRVESDEAEDGWGS